MYTSKTIKTKPRQIDTLTGMSSKDGSVIFKESDLSVRRMIDDNHE